jgi:hypothetical protein
MIDIRDFAVGLSRQLYGKPIATIHHVEGAESYAKNGRPLRHLQWRRLFLPGSWVEHTL